MGGRIRPTRGGLALLVLGLGLFVSARTTGAGWLMVIVALIAAVLTVGAVWPLRLWWSLDIEVSAPGDAAVGRPFDLSLRVRGGPFDARIRAWGSEWHWFAAPATGSLQVVPETRGVLDEVEITLWTGAPFGLFGVQKRTTAPLPQPVLVAPRPMPQRLPSITSGGTTGQGTWTGARSQGESVRSLREYSPGDPLRMVHWRRSASSSDLLVKELEAPQLPALAIIVDLRGPAAEEAASQAAGLVQAARRDGATVTLLTREPSGPVVGEVGSMLEAGRRLARAVAGVPPSGPVPEGALVVEVSGR